MSVITHYDKKEGGDVIDNNTEKSGTGNEIEKRNAGDTLFTLTRTEEYSAVSLSFVISSKVNGFIECYILAFYQLKSVYFISYSFVNDFVS